ncbi:MAG TPA: VanW family protein [Clostridia bacterium]|nr:VanW family protein [Clostridia bacterium]
MLFLFSNNRLPSRVYVDNINIGGLSKNEAAQKLDRTLGNAIVGKIFKLKFGEKIYEIKYSDIDAAIDSKATVNSAYGHGSGLILANFFNGNFSLKDKYVSPVITFNEGKLREKLKDFNVFLNRSRKNAYVYVDGKKVVEVPGKLGYRFNMSNAVNRIRKDLSKDMKSPVEFKVSNNYEISTLVPKVTIKDFNGIDEIIAQYTTKITDMDNADSIKQAVSAVNNSIIYSIHSNNGQGSIFSFNKHLQKANLLKSQNNEGYNQVASTLYAAMLIAGIDPNTITRTPHEETVDYIEPGLDACVLSDSGDLNFQNTLDCKILVNAEVKGDKVVVSILGKRLNNSSNSIKTEVQQRYTPTVINMENQDLKPGQKKMVSQGKEGLKVNVYRIMLSGGQEIDRQLLYYDLYKPIDAVIQIGPNTKWYNENISK